jgi:hypothetical protein
MSIGSSVSAPPCVIFCDQILKALASWSDHLTLKQACTVKVEVLAKNFQDLVLNTPHESMQNHWVERLMRFRANLLIHYEPGYDQLLVAVEQCESRLSAVLDLPFLEMPVGQTFSLRSSSEVTKAHLQALLVFKRSQFKLIHLEECTITKREMALFVDRLGYFPLDVNQYTVASLEYLWSVYAEYPHLPTLGISSLMPNANNLKVHKLCENFWLYSIRESSARKLVITEPVGGFYAVKESDLHPSRWVVQLRAKIGSNAVLLGKGDSFDTCTIMTSKALKYPPRQIARLLWKKEPILFVDGIFEVDLLKLKITEDAHPNFDYMATTYSAFEWFIRGQ